MHNNKMDDPIWCYSAFSKIGAITLAKTMQSKFGCEVFEQPILRDDSMWVIMFSNPLIKNTD